MSLLDIYNGAQTWPAYAAGQGMLASLIDIEPANNTNVRTPFEPALRSLKLGLAEDDYQIALESGLGALRGGFALGVEGSPAIELAFDKLVRGPGSLGADFNFLMGDLVWKFEMQEDSLNGILQEIRLAEFEREARAYRNRAERAYFNGWYAEALGDFLEAQKRNYPDFAVHRSIASIQLYHLHDLTTALSYFLSTAKYARPSDPSQAAEAYYFAAMICLMQRDLETASDYFAEATALDPDLLDAHYHTAVAAVLSGSSAGALSGLEAAIKGDPRYFERARREGVFDSMASEIQAMVERLTQPAREKAGEISDARERLKKFVIASPDQERISRIFEDIEQGLTGPKAVMAGHGFLERLARAQQELAGLYESFHKQYEFDPRDYVRSISFSPDGRWLAAGFLNGGITIWDIEAGLDGQSMMGHFASVNSVAFSPDSQLLATGSRDHMVKVWQVGARLPLLILRGHVDEVRAVAFNPDGQWLASGSHDKTVIIWRVETGREVQSLVGHTNKVTATLFSPDGKLLASGSADRTVKLWDFASGKTVLTLKGHQKGVASLAFSPDGRWLASGGDDTRVKVWDIMLGEEAKTLKGHRYGVTSVAFSPDGKLLAAGSLGRTITLWSMATGLPVKTLRFTDISYNSVAFSPKGEWLAFGSRDLQLWLKGLLTSEQYATVKAEEERGLMAQKDLIRPPSTPFSVGRHIFETFAEPVLRDIGLCEVCARRLGRIERLFHHRCKLHR